ncbi:MULTISPECIES: LysE family translocator [unclassified Mesorhizobium]|uniref:LysE family translocator n=1 Tax=unclassified Mesorhizobium TaxID=325217 RepID=UPI00095FD5C9|nr:MULTISPECIES: LysE family translocator [unclassified Mesorhizobium]MBN9255542.1 LysE family translocator [Mesorhizobium sp.]OJX83974.1 MAG: lysine transporter LysE [Mesorhizobium sp. 65-26]
MPSATALLTFVAALVVLEITPGPDMMLVVARGVGQGRRVALLTVIGMVFVAGVVQVGLLVLGVASLLQAYPAGLVILKWAGALYMLYLGVRMILASLAAHRDKRSAVGRISDWSAIRQGTINSLTNPKSLLFMFAFLPQFVDPGAGPIWLQLLVLGSIQKLAGILSLGSVAMASGTVGQWLYRWPGLLAWQQRFTGVVMIGLGLRLLLSGNAGPAPAAHR